MRRAVRQQVPALAGGDLEAQNVVRTDVDLAGVERERDDAQRGGSHAPFGRPGHGRHSGGRVATADAMRGGFAPRLAAMPITRALEPIDVARLRVKRRATSFRSLIAALDLRRVDSVLDVGAGGFVGQTTTTHLVDLIDAPITAVELDPDRAAALTEAFGDRLEVVCADAFDWDDDRTFDLVVLDIDTPRIPAIFEEHLEGRLLALLRPGGVLITVLVNDADQAFHGPKALPASNEQLILSFLERHFGSRRLTDRSLKRHYAEHPHYRALAMVEKWQGDPANFIAWLALQRLP
jgi:predicted O-methyltransferase YrrM